MTVAPNPASAEVVLGTNKAELTFEAIQLNDALGRSTPMNAMRTHRSWTLDVSNLPAGLYTVSGYLGGEVRVTERLMVAH